MKLTKTPILHFIFALCLAQSVLAEFTQVTVPSLPDTSQGNLSWADFDNDGRLDFLLTGGTASGVVSQLWQNTGSGFVNVTASMAAGLPGVGGSASAWGDFDNDGRLDFILAGNGVGFASVSQIWRNTGSGFTNVTSALAPGMPGVALGSVAWGDYDNDGRLDLFLLGNVVAQIWRNTGCGFTDVTATVAPGLVGTQNGALALADYDGDGRLDFLIAGRTASSSTICQLWRNTGSGFTNVTAAAAPGLTGFDYGSLAWGDYDSDGRPDFILNGLIGGGSIRTQIWRNTGSGFTHVTASVAPGLPNAGDGRVEWCDYDCDGRLDFLLSGDTGDGLISQLWRNTGSGFTLATAGTAPGLSGIAGAIAWGDYDGDGRPDLLVSRSDGIASTQLWKNTGAAANTPPTAPSGLRVTSGVAGLTFVWDAAADTQTAASALTYQLRLGTTPGGRDLLAPASAAGGLLRLPPAGSLLSSRAQLVANLPLNKPIYWSVQAADNTSAGSPFAAEQVVYQNAVLTQPNGVVVPGDTNGDGIVSAAEFAVVRSFLANELATQNAAGYYTTSQVQALNVGTQLLTRDAATGQFTLELGLEKSNTLQSFAPFPFLAPQTSVQPNGKLRFQFTSPDNAAFFRLKTQ